MKGCRRGTGDEYDGNVQTPLSGMNATFSSIAHNKTLKNIHRTFWAHFFFGTTNGSKFVTIYFICLFVSSLERTHTHTLRKLVGSEERLCGYMPYYLLTYRELRVCFGTKFKFRNCSGDDITHLCLVMALSLSLTSNSIIYLFSSLLFMIIVDYALK